MHGGDCLSVSIGANPRDRVTSVGASPDDALLTPRFRYIVGVINVRRPLTPMIIKFGPRRRLNGESCGGHGISEKGKKGHGLSYLEKHICDALHDITVLSHDVTEGVTNVSIGVRFVMHGEADVHGTIQVGRGFGFGECRALDGVEVVHVSTIHGFGVCAHFVCHLANWLPRPTWV